MPDEAAPQHFPDEWIDDQGYPTDAALERIRKWPMPDLKELMAFLKSIWWHADWGWEEVDDIVNDLGKQVHLYRIHTGGWSGNEDLIGAFEENYMCWTMLFYTHRRGGHYEFYI